MHLFDYMYKDINFFSDKSMGYTVHLKITFAYASAYMLIKKNNKNPNETISKRFIMISSRIRKIMLRTVFSKFQFVIADNSCLIFSSV